VRACEADAGTEGRQCLMQDAVTTRARIVILGIVVDATALDLFSKVSIRDRTVVAHTQHADPCLKRYVGIFIMSAAHTALGLIPRGYSPVH
jgi:hypothetical protein